MKIRRIRPELCNNPEDTSEANYFEEEYFWHCADGVFAPTIPSFVGLNEIVVVAMTGVFAGSITGDAVGRGVWEEHGHECCW